MGSHLLKEIEKLKKSILLLSIIIEEHIQKAVKSLIEMDSKLASEVIENDIEIDTMEVDIEEDILKILALHQPVAIDLRFLVASLKINSDLERIGDLGVNIAERTKYLAKHPRKNIDFDFSEMASKTRAMLKLSLDSLLKLDIDKALDVAQKDDKIDAMNKKMFKEVEKASKADPENTKIYLHFLSCSRHLERIADHATNIAEDVIYMVEGRIVRHSPEEFDD